MRSVGKIARIDGLGFFAMLSSAQPSPKTSDMIVIFCLTFISIAAVSAIIWENGDVEQKWLAAKAWADLQFPNLVPNHHNLRWGVNIPAAIFVHLFGDSPRTYLCFNYLIFSFSTVLLYRLAHAFTSQLIAVIIIAIWLLNPEVYNLAANLMPEIFEIFYILLALSLLRASYTRDSVRLFALSIGAFFLMYGAKETSVFFLPGLAIYETWRGKYGRVAIMVSVFFALLLLETAIIDFWLRDRNVIFGRAEVITGGEHVKDMKTSFAYLKPIDMFRRWWFNADTNLDRLGYYSKALYIVMFALWIWLLFRRLSGSAAVRAGRGSNNTIREIFLHAVVATSISFSLCVTFFVISLHPFILGMPLNDRYLWVLLVPSLLIIAAFLRWLEERYANPLTDSSSSLTTKTGPWRELTRHHWLGAAFILILLVSTVEREAINLALVNIRRAGFGLPYRFHNVNKYYSTFVRDRLVEGCTLIFATRRAAWSAIIFAFPYGYFPDVASLQVMKLDGLRTRDGGTIHGWQPQVAEWPGLGRKPYVWPYERDGHLEWEIYAIRLELGTAQQCRMGYYLGHVDLHPRDQALGQQIGS